MEEKIYEHRIGDYIVRSREWGGADGEKHISNSVHLHGKMILHTAWAKELIDTEEKAKEWVEIYDILTDRQ